MSHISVSMAVSPMGNRLLAALPREELAHLQPHLEDVALEFKQALREPNRRMPYVYFPCGGVVSLLAFGDGGGDAVEVATMGNEGMVGLPAFLGVETMPHQAIVQIAGDAVRMAAPALRDEVRPGSALYALLQRSTQALLVTMAQTAACNRLHAIGPRCARWLLQTHDRVQADEFSLTQEFLGQMLGVRRATVNGAAGALQEAGLIRYRRGMITILDRPGLEAHACACYRIIAAEFERLLG